MRSMVDSGILFFICIATFITVVLENVDYVEAFEASAFESFEAEDADAEMGSAVRVERSTDSIRELLVSKEGFLAGEDTPVWLAHNPNDGSPVVYDRLIPGLVKEAMKIIGGNTIKVDPSIEKYLNRETLSENDFASSFSNTVYPTVLVVMDYNTVWPADEEKEDKLLLDRILYGLTFWNGVDLQLRHIQNPKVRIRVGGIIINYNKQASPYVYDNLSKLGVFDSETATSQMIEYWTNMALNHDYFPKDAYDFVVTMTDLKPLKVHYSKTMGHELCFASSQHKVEVPGIILADDLAFGGIKVAVHEMVHILGERKHDGDSTACPEEKGTVMAPTLKLMGRKWSQCSLKHLSMYLQRNYHCMDKPKEYYPPGKPVETILPGRLLYASALCKARNPKYKVVCWGPTSCDKLMCGTNWKSCENTGPALDGNTCSRSHSCLDGQCVSNVTLH